jgi:hypothetical protein
MPRTFTVFAAFDFIDAFLGQYIIGLSMELFLNSAWALLAIASVCLWIRLERRIGAERRLPPIALTLLLVILFPVISVSDDLQMLQYPAESDTFQCQRRDCLASCPHAVHPAMAALPESVFAEAAWSFQRFTAELNFSSRAVENPAFDTIQNRPPPAA